MDHSESTCFNADCPADFLSRHDMVFERPAPQWERGAPMGNGLLGAMAWGGGDDPIRLSIDRADVWELRNRRPDFSRFNWETFTGCLERGDKDAIDAFCVPEPGQPQPTRIPVGRLELTPAGKVLSHTMRLSLHEALTTGLTRTERGEIRWRAFVAATRPVIVFETWTSGAEALALRPKFVSRPGDYTPEDTASSTRFRAMAAQGRVEAPLTMTKLLQQWRYPPSVEGRTGDVCWWRQGIPDCGGYAVGWKRIRIAEGHEILLITIGYDRENPDPSAEAVATLQGIGAAGFDSLYAEHCAWWAEYWEASLLSIPDTRLEALYYIETYKLGSCTRPGGPLMTIAGPWTDDDNLPPICANDYHWNLEQQMHLWSVYAANRLDYGMPLYDMIDRCRPNLRRFCRDFFGRPGEFLAHCTDPDGNPMLMNADNFEFNGLPWVCFMYWQHYRYGMDADFLRNRAYPLMKEALRPLLAELREEADGYLHLPWSSSPEYHSPQETYRWFLHEAPDWSSRFGPDATIDLALIRFLCRALLESCGILGIQGEDRAAWEDTLARLAPYPVDRFGGLAVRRGLPLESSHRHQSHLFPIYPLHELTMEHDAELIKHCLDVLGIHGRGEWVGWAFPWVALLGAYGGRPAMARNLLLDYADRYVTESTMHYQGPQNGCDVSLYGGPDGNFGLTIEGGLGAIAAIQELALQSNGGVVHLFEASPPAWADLALWNMRAEGAFVLSAVRENYVTRFVHVRAERGGLLRLRTALGGGPLHVESGPEERPYALENGTIAIETRPGEELLLWAGDARPECAVRPLKGIENEYHYYGVKRVSRF